MPVCHSGDALWGRLVGSLGPHSPIDGGSITVPRNAGLVPLTERLVAENRGIQPDIEVRDYTTSSDGDAQLERAIEYINEH